MNEQYDIVIIGAGPAGMAAAKLCGSTGASTLLLDEQSGPGGQIYRGIENPAIVDPNILGSDYYKGTELAEGLRQASIDYRPGAKVWQVSSDNATDKEVSFSEGGIVHIVSAKRIIIATGAQERPFPLPGWTLSGVMNAGAAQILLKTSAIAAENAVFIGSGPLLYLIVRQYLLAGVPIKAVIDTNPLSNYLRAAPYLINGLSEYKTLVKGQRWIKEIKKSGVPFINGVKELRLSGSESVESVEYTTGGEWNKLDTDNVFLHQGVVPSVNLTMSMRCTQKWCNTQLCWCVVTDAWCETDIAGVFVAGDGATIVGAIAAEHLGTIAALGALHQLGLLDEVGRDSQAESHRKVLLKGFGFRKFLDRLFQPPRQFRIPKYGDTVVCRCEEVTAGKIREIIKLGCTNRTR